MKDLTHLDNELLRKAILRYLAYHHPAGFTARSLSAVLRTRGFLDWDPQESSVTSALCVLQDLSLVKEIKSPIGSTAYWSCTASGKIAIERDEL